MRMDEYKEIVEKMNPEQRREAARKSFTNINELPSSQKDDIVLGLCGATKLYSSEIKEYGLIDEIENLNEYITQSERLDKNERFESGIKSFFLINNFPTTQRDEIFTGLYASAKLGNKSIDTISNQVISDVDVERIESIW